MRGRWNLGAGGCVELGVRLGLRLLRGTLGVLAAVEVGLVGWEEDGSSVGGAGGEETSIPG